MSKGNRRRDWKAKAERKRTPGGFMPPTPKKHDKHRDEKSRRWQDGD